MIPRYQKVILWMLLVSSVLMAAYLIRMRARAQDQLAAVPDAAPMPVPVEAPPVEATLMIANDEDGTLAPVQQQLALPQETTTRARTLLNDLFAEYAQPGSPHPLAAVSAISDVFLLPVPESTPPGSQELAVINLSAGFVDHHPSGILVETLTLLSMLGTLHANLPQIAQVRFLVDGHPRETLAGHADLTRTYLTANDVPSVAAPDGASPHGETSDQQKPAGSQP
ncbi:MAG: GerMN domain-containing protein [Terriglobia bacterium]|nr:GerMN domain-containing protein [Terriglobia bacterium]